MAVKASYLATGLTTRVHGNTKHKPKHALNFDEIKNLVTFLHNYAEKNAILLPGRIPGYREMTFSFCHPQPLRRYTHVVYMYIMLHAHNAVNVCTCTSHVNH